MIKITQFTLNKTIKQKPPDAHRGAFLNTFHLSKRHDSGASNQYCSDIYETAHMRQLGEYTAEQVFSTSMAEGFEAIGLKPDPRAAENGGGYSVIPLVLEYLRLRPKKIVLLSNNLDKGKTLAEDFKVERISLYGHIDKYDLSETEGRIREFGQLMPLHFKINYRRELRRLCREIRHITQKNGVCKNNRDRLTFRRDQLY